MTVYIDMHFCMTAPHCRYCNTNLLDSATHCNTLYHPLQRIVTHIGAHSATHCNTLQRTATHCNTHLFASASRWGSSARILRAAFATTLSIDAERNMNGFLSSGFGWYVLQYVAVALQFVAVRVVRSGAQHKWGFVIRVRLV